MSDIKQRLKNNKYTAPIYKFFYICKHDSIKQAILKVCVKLLENKECGSIVNIVNNNRDSYKLPDLLLENEHNTKKLEIISCAFRKHEPNKGLTGGPNGVLATEQEIFGDIYHGIRMRYLFHSKNVEYPKHLEKALKGYTFMLKINFYAAYYLEYCINSWSRLSKDTDFFFICHDVGFAYGAYLRNCKYALIYHTQGSLVNERESFGEQLSEKDKILFNKLEKIVFENAEMVYFPSMGAKESFIKTTKIDLDNVNFATEPLYNTITDAPELLNEKELLSPLALKTFDRNNTDVFLSVGDFSENKGLERIPLVLNEYVKRTGKKVYWIAIGSKHKAGIYEKLLEEKSNWLFESSLYGERVNHDTLLALMKYTDYYIMLQRHSIFDLSTLEAMRAGKAMILSNVGGNLEVNREDNIILVDLDNLTSAIDRMEQTDKRQLGEKNKYVFEKYFSKKQFFNSYSSMINYHAEQMGVSFSQISEKNKINMKKWKKYYNDKTVVICGSGSSLENYKEEKNAIHIALNKALFFNRIKFDILFMQDYPKNQEYTLKDYDQYPCIKFYGNINNIITRNMGFWTYGDTVNGEVTTYELAPLWFDYRVDNLDFKLDENYFVDAQSVLFSAIQFAIFAGAKKIILYGIEFSEENYGNTKNPNNYANSVEDNLIYFKKKISEDYPEIEFLFGSTTNKRLLKAFAEIDKRGVEE